MDKLSPDYFHMMPEVSSAPDNKGWQYTCATAASVQVPNSTNCTVKATNSAVQHGFFVNDQIGALVIGQQQCIDKNCSMFYAPMFVAGIEEFVRTCSKSDM
jgi:hypothetical protein